MVAEIPERPLIAVLSNPASGGNRKHLPAIRNILADRNHVNHREAATLSEISAAVEELLHQRPTYLVLNGGDGTIQAVLTKLLTQKIDHQPLLVVLKAGTTSMTAGDIGLRGPAPHALKNFLSRVATNIKPPVKARLVLRIDTDDGPPLSGMFFGAGCIPQGIRYFHEKVNRPGLRGELGPALVVARFLWNLVSRQQQVCRPPTLAGSLDGQPLAVQPYLLLMATTMKRLFFGWHPFWNGGNQPIHFSAVRERPRHFFRLLPSLVRGRTHRLATPANGYFSRNVAEVTITNLDQFTLDGQLYEPSKPTSRVTVSSDGPVFFVRI